MRSQHRLTWREILALKQLQQTPAAVDVLPHGVYRALRIRGLIRLHDAGYQVTAEGLAALTMVHAHPPPTPK